MTPGGSGRRYTDWITEPICSRTSFHVNTGTTLHKFNPRGGMCKSEAGPTLREERRASRRRPPAPYPPQLSHQRGHLALPLFPTPGQSVARHIHPAKVRGALQSLHGRGGGGRRQQAAGLGEPAWRKRCFYPPRPPKGRALRRARGRARLCGEGAGARCAHNTVRLRAAQGPAETSQARHQHS